jgi:hypothetical protein
MTVLILLLIGFPLLFIGFATRRFGFAAAPTLLASVAGEIVALVLFPTYTKWKVAAVISGRAPGAVLYFPAASLSSRIVGWLTVCAFGAAIGLIVLLLRRLYSRAQSA